VFYHLKVTVWTLHLFFSFKTAFASFPTGSSGLRKMLQNLSEIPTHRTASGPGKDSGIRGD
jgi:hypothetical protein